MTDVLKETLASQCNECSIKCIVYGRDKGSFNTECKKQNFKELILKDCYILNNETYSCSLCGDYCCIVSVEKGFPDSICSHPDVKKFYKKMNSYEIQEAMKMRKLYPDCNEW